MYWFSTVWEMHWSDTEVVRSTLKYKLFCYALAGDVLEIPAVTHSPQLQVESCDCTTITLLAALWPWFIACAMISSCTLNKSGPEQLKSALLCYKLTLNVTVCMNFTHQSFTSHKTVPHCFVDCTSHCHQIAFLRWIGFTFIWNPVWYRDRQRGVFIVWDRKSVV